MGSVVCTGFQDDTIINPPMRILTDDQVKIIQKSWEIPSASPIDAGERILFTFLERYPHNMQSFQAFKNTPLLLLKGTPGFRSHASKIMNIFAVSIDSLDKVNGFSEVQKILAEVGKSHAKKKLPKQAFLEIRGVIIDVMKEVAHIDEDGEEAWNGLLDIVCHILFECFDGNSEQFYN